MKKTAHELFSQFIQKFDEKYQEILRMNEDTICKQILTDLNLPDTNLNESDAARFIQALNNNMIIGRGFSGLIENGDDLEPDTKMNHPKAQYQITARNLLRHITLGVVVPGGEKRKQYHKSLALIENLIIKKRDNELLKVGREALKHVFENVSRRLIDDPQIKLTSQDEKQFEIFISYLLAILPFIDPEEGEGITLPQKVNGLWIRIKYQFKKINISPRKGFLSKLLEEEDYIYAYGLAPLENADSDVRSHLLLMGTTYPRGQGADLSMLANFWPGYSIGEVHNIEEVGRWVAGEKRKINVTGLSQGAVMAMIVAGMYPEKINKADCLNPMGLHLKTLDRLNKTWLKSAIKPQINVYAQAGDPIFPFEKGFLEGTQIWRVFTANKKYSTYKWFIPPFIQRAIEHHVRYFSGHHSVIFLKIKTIRESASVRREFFTIIKRMVNGVFFPVLYMKFCIKLCVRKANRFCPL